MKLLSVIIPTYNMAKYLNRCLDSLVVDPLLSDLLEVIVVNDGSKDDSSAIAHEYQTKYSDVFRVIDKENGNYGSCVNRGIKECTGKYVKVLDSDDYFNTLQFSKYIEQLKDAESDLVLTDYSIVYTNSEKKENRSFDFEADKVHRIGDVCCEPSFLKMEMHAITYKVDVLKSINYTQTEGISYTDQEWIFTPMSAVKSVLYMKYNVYQYVMGRVGQTVDESSYRKNIEQLLKVALSQTRTFASVKHSVSKSQYDYLHTKLMLTLGNTYRRFLLKEGYPISKLPSFDREIAEIDNEIYAELDTISLYGLHFYIKHYHETEEPSAFPIRKIYQLGKRLFA